MGTQLPLKGHSPLLQFVGNVRCDQAAGRTKTPLGMKVGLGPGHIVLDGDPAPPQKGHSPQFSTHVCCGQTAGRIKMPLGMEVSLGPGHIVLDGDSAFLPKKGHYLQIFGPCLLWPTGWIDQDVIWDGGRPRSSLPYCARWGPSSPKEGAQPSPNFWPMSVVAKRLDGSR